MFPLSLRERARVREAARAASRIAETDCVMLGEMLVLAASLTPTLSRREREKKVPPPTSPSDHRSP